MSVCVSVVTQQKPEALQKDFKQQAGKEDNSSHPQTVRNCIILRDHGHPCSAQISENRLCSGQQEPCSHSCSQKLWVASIPAAPNGFKARALQLGGAPKGRGGRAGQQSGGWQVASPHQVL